MSPLSALPTSRFRVDVVDLKLQMAKRLGSKRARRYFSYLDRLLSQKLSKAEFNKLCVLTIGLENLPLHNHLIRSVLRNACQARMPVLPRNSVHREDGLNQTQQKIWGNGDFSLHPPQRQTSKHRQSIVGMRDMTNFPAEQNFDLGSYDFEGGVEGPGSEQAEQHVKRFRQNTTNRHEVVVGEDMECLEPVDGWNLFKCPLLAPIGIPFYQARVGRTKRSPLLVGSACIDGFSSNLDDGELCNTEDLRKRMERVTEVLGLGRVTMECAILLNNGLDAYLKRLINSCIELVGARMDHETVKQTLPKQEACGNPFSGALLDNYAHIQRSNDYSQLQERNCCLISLQDFTGAMELNPQQLGTNAPLLMEKIRLHSFTE